MSSTSSDHAVSLRSVGLRVTSARLAVLEALEAHPHATIEQARELAIAKIGSLSVQATYDVLAALCEAGLIRRVEPAGSVARFELATGDNHHHLKCRRCGDLRDVACHRGVAPCLEPTNAQGFTVDEAEVIYWGICPACLTAEGTV
ncbi:MAG: Fur family transcriptional regulator [Propionibacteriaceae bacterium]|nr:Fur family transcriptional regulator [Propionibacteriaceae bacterium]